ncbi:lysophospholipid acyltransferase family protein [Microbacterium radiodurans]|uniref:1-acyl-sn-glycerol-3-phosphate acyltransferase n=1 Tax=Microbacterium radiodurans TaxID=661398 RepID=A0A5J5IQ44_9MICO|nr:lysophospholipid acyltransferase family protein [Microbacterium radiodurans]KAA9085308.1 1-acyl-sn-glycerol-3-phosphate acyltransferase [Microbacterium radiodurans]
MMSAPLLRVIGRAVFDPPVRRNLSSVTGTDRIPAGGPVVVVANHTSYLDHFVLMRTLRRIRPDAPWFLTKSESFRHPIGRAWATAWQGIPVDRDSPSVRTVREVRAVLRRDGVLVVYPEGTRSRQPERLGSFTSGAFRFAADARVPLVPVAITGAERVLPAGARRFRRARIDVRVGCPLVVADERPASVRAHLLAVAARDWMSAALTEMSASRPERAARDRAPAGPSPSPEVLS